jgi:hypothetical protein
MGITLLQGKPLAPENGAERRLVTVVNEALASRIWPGELAVGKRLRRGSGDEAILIEVVGVVRDVTMQALGEDPLLQAFWRHDATPWARELYFALRTPVDPVALVPLVRRAVEEVDPRIPVAEMSTMEGRVARQLAGPRFRTLLVAGFSVVATFLSLLGLYGITSFVVARRTREIGVRMALGARRQRVMARVLGQGFLLTGMGVVVGLAGGTALARTARALLFRTQPVQPQVMAGVAALLFVCTLTATWIPARRASGVDPTEALRAE